MKLTESQIRAIHAKTGAQPIPATNIVLKQFVEAFGEHTFYIDPLGLVIWEPEPGANGARLAVRAVQVAAWSDGDRSRLVPHPPRPGETLVRLA